MCSLGHQQQQARKKNIVPLLKLNPVLFSRLLFDDDMGRGAHSQLLRLFKFKYAIDWMLYFNESEKN